MTKSVEARGDSDDSQIIAATNKNVDDLKKAINLL